MQTNLTLFAQIIKSLCRTSFKNLVNRHDTDKHNKGIDSWTPYYNVVLPIFKT